jgi:uroporphyrinogen decarboxylase
MMELLDEDSHLQIRKLLDYGSAAVDSYLTLMAEAGADVLSNGDSPAGPDLVSPTLYRDFACAYEARAVKTSHQLGKPYVLHICGNTQSILEEMVGTGADALEIDYKTPLDACVRATKDRCAFIGNIDPSGVLALGTPELVRSKTVELLQAFEGNPRFILNAGCALPPSTPPQNIRAMLEVAGRG